MLSCVLRALKPEGQFVFEMGGKGNNALIHGSLCRTFERRGLIYRFPFYFPAIGEYASLMEDAGFLVRTALLFDRKTKLMGTIMLLSMLTALVLLGCFSRPVLRVLFGSIEDDVMDYAVTYLVITAMSYPFLSIYNAGAAIFRCLGNSRISMNISIVMNLINIVGNAVFVLVFHWTLPVSLWQPFSPVWQPPSSCSSCLPARVMN